MSMSVCVCVCVSDLQMFCACCLWLRLGLSPASLRHTVHCTSGVVDDIVSFFYNGPYSGMSFATKNRFRLNLLIYCKVEQNSISYY